MGCVLSHALFSPINLSNNLAMYYYVSRIVGAESAACVLLFRRGIVGEIAQWRWRRDQPPADGEVLR